MKTKDKIIFLITVFVVIGWLLFLVRSVLTPFIIALIVAYFLDPLVDRLHEKYRFSRLAATSLILGIFLAAFIGLGSLIFPIIYTQFVTLVGVMPDYLKTITDDFYPRLAEFLNQFGFHLNGDFHRLAEDEAISSRVVEISQNIFNNALHSSMTLINVISLLFITPILVFYLLKDWDLLVKKLHDYLPQGVSAHARQIGDEIDKTLSGYVRGQFNVCFILGIIYSTLLSFSGLNFGFLIGFLTGLFSFIPFVGMLCGVIAATIVGLFQWGLDPTKVLVITSIFLIGQAIESNFLTPKLIGAKIGLHPVWIIFGLFVFGSLFGFMGVLLAVPLTAVFGVIIKHLALEYKRFI